MPANIEKRPQRISRVTGDDDALTSGLAKKIVARRGYSVRTPGADPVLAVEAFEFLPEQIGIRVVAGGQRRGGC